MVTGADLRHTEQTSALMQNIEFAKSKKKEHNSLKSYFVTLT